MEVEQAMNLVSGVVADFRGTLKDHQALQQAIAVIKRELDKKVVPVNDNKSESET